MSDCAIDEKRLQYLLSLESKLLAGEIVEPVRCKVCLFRGTRECPKNDGIYNSLDSDKYCAWGKKKTVDTRIPLDKQAEFVAKNHKLIFEFLKIHNLSVDEWYDVCAIGLCKSARSFDPSRGSAFSTYAFRVIDNEVKMELRKVNRRVNTISLETPIDNNRGETFELHELIGAEDERLDEVMAFHDIVKKLEKYKTRHRERDMRVFRLLCSGYSQARVSEITGLSRSYICKIIYNIRQCLKEVNCG
jgi:RNA polymerase sigma factor (sigma-70 family)